MFIGTGLTQRELMREPVYGVYTRIFIENTWNPADVLGIPDSMIEAEWTADLDQPTIEGTIKIFRGPMQGGLSPLMDPGPYRIWPGMIFTFSVACVPQGVTPSGADYMHMFYGRIDAVNMAPDESSLAISFRDAGAWFLNAWVREPTTYLSGPVQSVMAQIIADWAPSNELPGLVNNTLFTPDDPGWVISDYIQEETSVLEAIRALALQIGWDVRYYSAQVASGILNTLRFRNPVRDNPSIDTTINDTEYLAINTLEISDVDVRNHVEVWYVERQLYTAEDADSIAQYGRRWMRIAEEKSSNINTVEEAQRMAEAALADLSQPGLTHSVDLRLWPFVELGDFYEFGPDFIHHNNPLQLAVVGFTHRISNKSCRTTLNCRGAPAAANANWRTGRPQTTFVSLNEPTGIAPEGSIWFRVTDLTIVP